MEFICDLVLGFWDFLMSRQEMNFISVSSIATIDVKKKKEVCDVLLYFVLYMFLVLRHKPNDNFSEMPVTRTSFSVVVLFSAPVAKQYVSPSMYRKVAVIMPSFVA